VQKSILVIDDETMILEAIKIIFEDMGYSVHTTSDPLKGTEEAIHGTYDLILTDIRMPQRNGAEITEAVRAARPAATSAVDSTPSKPRTGTVVALICGTIESVAYPAASQAAWPPFSTCTLRAPRARSSHHRRAA